MWERRESTRRERERAAQWREVVEEVRRRADGELRSSNGNGALPSYLEDRLALGPHARDALRPVPRRGRVVAAGVDTWSPCWYAKPGTALARAMKGLASHSSRRASLLPERVDGYRVGWFPEPGLVFAEGRPLGEDLCPAGELREAAGRLGAALEDLGVPLERTPCAGLRRLDVAADLWTDSSVEGLVLLECIGAASLGVGKLATYRSDRCVESVLIKSRAGRTQARVYDKGVQTGLAPPGRWIRLEGQWRFAQKNRPAIGQLGGDVLRDRFRSRFEPLWQAAEGFELGGVDVVCERIAAAVEAGQLRPSRARSVAGYLLLSASGVPQGAKRTAYELEYECRQLGLSISLLQKGARRVDVATILEECMTSDVWPEGRERAGAKSSVADSEE